MSVVSVEHKPKQDVVAASSDQQIHPWGMAESPTATEDQQRESYELMGLTAGCNKLEIEKQAPMLREAFSRFDEKGVPLGSWHRFALFSGVRACR